MPSPPLPAPASTAGACKGTVSDWSTPHPILPPTARAGPIRNRRHSHDPPSRLPNREIPNRRSMKSRRPPGPGRTGRRHGRGVGAGQRPQRHRAGGDAPGRRELRRSRRPLGGRPECLPAARGGRSGRRRGCRVGALQGQRAGGDAAAPPSKEPAVSALAPPHERTAAGPDSATASSRDRPVATRSSTAVRYRDQYHAAQASLVRSTTPRGVPR